MKTAEEWLDLEGTDCDETIRCSHKHLDIDSIKAIQLDAYNQAIRDAAEYCSKQGYRYQQIESVQDLAYFDCAQSILKYEKTKL